MKKIKNGFSLIEIMLALSIVISLSAIIVFVYKKTSDSYKTDAAVSQLVSIKSEIDTAPSNLDYEKAFEYIIYNNSTLDKKNISNNKLKNVWGGEVNVLNKGDNAYNLVYTNVPVDSCVSLISNSKAIYKSAKVSDLDYVDAATISDISDYCSNQKAKNLSISFSELKAKDIQAIENVENEEKAKAAEEEAKAKADADEQAKNDAKTPAEIAAEEKAKAEADKKQAAADLKVVKAFANNMYFQWPFETAEKNNYPNNSFSFFVEGKPYFVQGPASAIQEFYVSLVNAKDQSEISSLTAMTQNKNNLYSINVGDTVITATYITSKSSDYYRANFKQAKFNDYRK